MTITIDYTNMLAPAVAGGIPAEAWVAAGESFAATHAAVQALRATGALGFLDLPGNSALHQQCTAFAAQARGNFDDIVLLGIGGSALGPIALRTALLHPDWNALPRDERDNWPRFHVLDNVDPGTIAALLSRVNPARTLFIVISKSGGTAETMAQYLIVRGRLDVAFGDKAREHLVFVTDPEHGALRAIARAENIPAVDIPPNVGGRFSVLTPVGILPAALLGMDTAALLAGAADMAKRCETAVLRENPGAVFGVLQWMADTTLGRNVHVLMPYSDPFRDVAAWFVQLWAESLGKHRTSDGASVGPTPLAALGATDQHSQVQLFMEGTPNKTITFVQVGEHPVDVAIPKLHQDIPELAYLGGHHLGELIDIERRATAGALATRGRLNMTIHVDRADAWHLGGLFMLLEIGTIYAGQLYGVNALNQPGVELGKQFTYAMLGREDAADARQQWETLPKPNPDASV
ncbi:MAG TPA: glucose-6-phosphate isomerase [Gemmatimonadaceae bacterium]|jgi:glucose-6-phosphate isomerase|nr:glucose-6-phosphate isomerase [Gemmatimonadaceae bacterium]